MSRLWGNGGDDALHYEDNSHRWIPPDAKIPQENWDALMQAHLAQHRERMGDPPTSSRTPPPEYVRSPRRTRTRKTRPAAPKAARD